MSETLSISMDNSQKIMNGKKLLPNKKPILPPGGVVFFAAVALSSRSKGTDPLWWRSLASNTGEKKEMAIYLP
jgi:hypothetical protein